MSNKVKKFLEKERNKIVVDGFSYRDNQKMISHLYNGLKNLNVDILHIPNTTPSPISFVCVLGILIKLVLRGHSKLPTPEYIHYSFLNKYAANLSYGYVLCPTQAWFDIDRSSPINCALAVVIDSTMIRQLERVRKLAANGVGIGLTLLVTHIFDFLEQLEKILLSTTSKRDKRVSVFIPSFHPGIQQVLEFLRDKNSFVYINFGVIIFKCRSNNEHLKDSFPVLSKTASQNEMVDFYSTRRKIPETSVVANGISNLFSLKSRRILYLLDGYNLSKKFSSYEPLIKRQFPDGVVSSNLCNEVNLPLDPYSGKFQLCMLMGINYISYKQLNSQSKISFIAWLILLMKNLWLDVKSSNEYDFIEESMNPIGLYFVGILNEQSMCLDLFVQEYKDLIALLTEYDYERFFKAYVTLPPGSNIAKTWHLTTPMNIFSNDNVTVQSDVGNFTVDVMKFSKGFSVEDKVKIYELIDSPYFMGSSIEVTGDEEFDELYKLYINELYKNINVNYYNLPSTTGVYTCESCEA